jgi:hypothetical protein
MAVLKGNDFLGGTIWAWRAPGGFKIEQEWPSQELYA